MNSAARIVYRHPQRLAAAGVLLLISVLSACEAPYEAVKANSAPAANQSTSPGEQDSAPQSLGEPSTGVEPSGAAGLRDDAVEENPDLGGAIKQNMSYTELRKAMETHGWKPASDESCMVSMIGPDHGAFCSAHPDSQRCGYCSQLPGLRQCSADGYCLFVFERSSDHKRLEVGMQGELENWKYNAPDTMFGVSGWRYPLEGGD